LLVTAAVDSPAKLDAKRPSDGNLVPSTKETDSRREELSLKQQQLELQRAELRFKEEESRFGRSAENWKSVATVASVVVASLGVAVPLWLGLRTLAAQRRIANDQAATQLKVATEQGRLQFQIKASELVLTNSTNAQQAGEKARALAALFDPDLLPKDFAASFNPKMFRLDFGGSIARRRDLLNLLAQYPQQRDQILSDWYVLFRADWWFIEPFLQGLNSEERARLDDLRKRLEMNDDRASHEAKLSAQAETTSGAPIKG
jgi:hypothetical protein